MYRSAEACFDWSTLFYQSVMTKKCQLPFEACLKFKLKFGFILTSGCSPWILDIPCWILDIEYLAVMLDVGYSVLVIEYLAVMLVIGYSVLDIGY